MKSHQLLSSHETLTLFFHADSNQGPRATPKTAPALKQGLVVISKDTFDPKHNGELRLSFPTFLAVQLLHVLLVSHFQHHPRYPLKRQHTTQGKKNTTAAMKTDMLGPGLF